MIAGAVSVEFLDLSRVILASSRGNLSLSLVSADNKQLLDEVERDIMNYQNRGLCYNTDMRF